MGVYFMAASSKSRARDTLERPLSTEQLSGLLADDVLDDVQRAGAGEGVYVWGTMDTGRGALEQLRPGEYVVDVNGAEVVQVFEFLLAYRPEDISLQQALGWTEGGAKPFTHVMFLRRPRAPRDSHRDKAHFQQALGFDKPSWLSRSRYFDSESLASALARCEVDTVEALLGIDAPVSQPRIEPVATPQRAAPRFREDSREARRKALREEMRRDWHTARVNLVEASARLLELATRAVKRVEERRARGPGDSR